MSDKDETMRNLMITTFNAAGDNNEAAIQFIRKNRRVLLKSAKVNPVYFSWMKPCIYDICGPWWRRAIRMVFGR